MKVFESCFRVQVITFATDEAVDPVGVGPVRFDRNGIESSFLDQTPRDGGALCVEFMGTMRRFADKDDLRMSEMLQEGPDVGRFTTYRQPGVSDGFRRCRRRWERGWI